MSDATYFFACLGPRFQPRPHVVGNCLARLFPSELLPDQSESRTGSPSRKNDGLTEGFSQASSGRP